MDRDFQRTPGCLLRYKVGDQIIVHCYDAPHVIKAIRNNFQKKDVRHFIDGRWDALKAKAYGKMDEASWDYVTELFEADKNGCPRSLPKISEEHINPSKLKLRVAAATQVFSQTFGTVMLDFAEKCESLSEAVGTAQFLLFVNDLFDSINGSGPSKTNSLKGSITQESVHFLFWDWALFMLEQMSFIDKRTGDVNNRSTVFLKASSTIRGYQEVTRICFKEGLEEVSLR